MAETMNKYIFNVPNTELYSHTALGLFRNGDFLIQLDGPLNHPLARNWHIADRADWTLLSQDQKEAKP